MGLRKTRPAGPVRILSLKTKKPPVSLRRETGGGEGQSRKRLLFLQHRETGALILDDLVAIRKLVESAFFDFAAKEEQLGDAAVGTLLLFQVEIVGFTGFFTDDAVSYDSG